MNFHERPEVDDLSILHAHARNTRATSFPLILQSEAALITAYMAYIAAEGNAAEIQAVQLAMPTRAVLRAEYECKSKTLVFIGDLRHDNADRICPMCGSFGCGTLDHLLPRAAYPEFSIFSLNLVPACGCNTRRSDTVKGPNGERVLHPYFDKCLIDRLLKISIEDPGEAPKIKVSAAVEEGHPLKSSVEFHVNQIVRRSAIHRHLERRWATLYRSPATLLPTISIETNSPQALRAVVNAELLRLDSLHAAKNNWDSVFIEALLAQPVIDWLLTRIHNEAAVVL